MRLGSRLMMAALAVFSMGLMSMPAAAPVVAQSPCGAAEAKLINVDGTSPAGHDWEFTDFFPRVSTTVHFADCLHFHWSSGSPDGFHTTTLLTDGKTPQQAWFTDYPVTASDSDTGDPAGQQQLNPAINNSTFPPAGSGAPGACGDMATPCGFDATSDLNSGPQPTSSGFDFFVQLSVSDHPIGETQVLNFVCLIHPGMAGSVTVISSDSATTTLSQDAASAAAQETTDAQELADLETADNSSSTTTNSDGTKTVTARAGAGTAHGELLEFLPGTADVANNKWVNKIDVQAGDKIKWTAKDATSEIHTVSFPAGPAGDSTEPLPFLCENVSGDTPVDFSLPGPPCGNPALFEIHFNPAPQGPTSVSTPATVTSAGIIDGSPSPLPPDYTFTFPNAGTFGYDCHIHSHMAGQVLAAAVPALPAAGSGAVPAPGVPGGNPLPLLIALAATALALLGAGGLLLRRRQAA